MKRAELIQELHCNRLVAVARSKTAEDALALAQAAAASGIRFVEITFSVPGALKVIQELAMRCDLHVGAGTVLSKVQGAEAVAAGAEFVVSPSLELDLIPLCHSADVAAIPGAATPTEVLTAARAEADLVKIFPADCAGGANFIRQMSGPFPDVRFMVSGGVNLQNVREYVDAGVTGICLGSSYLGALLAERGRAGFVAEIQQFVQTVTAARR